MLSSSTIDIRIKSHLKSALWWWWGNFLDSLLEVAGTAQEHPNRGKGMPVFWSCRRKKCSAASDDDVVNPTISGWLKVARGSVYSILRLHSVALLPPISFAHIARTVAAFRASSTFEGSVPFPMATGALPPAFPPTSFVTVEAQSDELSPALACAYKQNVSKISSLKDNLVQAEA
ncbi:hypothetical protein KCU88_g139, partial [Aureobasidium melanogenum]